MSRYLIRRIEESSNIAPLTDTEVVSLAGNDLLETVEWRNNKTGETDNHEEFHRLLVGFNQRFTGRNFRVRP